MSRALFPFLVLLSATGCSDQLGSKAMPQTTWLSSRYSSAEDEVVYRNFYSEFEDFDRYTGYGIVHYTRKTTNDANRPVEELLEDSLSLCRTEFKDAYLAGTLTRWNGKTTSTVPYLPQFIAVVMDDFAGKTLDQVGIVVPAAELFSEVPTRNLVASSTITRGRIWFDDITEVEKTQGYSPGKVVRYKHIEQHMHAKREHKK